MSGTERIEWRNHAINFVGVIVGVYLAFAVTTCQESNNREAMKRQYLLALKGDLEKDIHAIESDINILDSVSVKTERLKAFADGVDMPDDSVSYYFSGLVTLTSFHPNNFAFASMVNTGLLTNFEDVTLTTDLTELYNGRYANIKEFDVLAMNNFQDYVIGPMTRGNSFDTKSVRTKGFSSLVYVVQGVNHNKRREYTQAKALAQKILKDVNGMLDQ